MHIKFTKHGTGSAKKAAQYLTNKQDHLGKDRAGVEILKGDPFQVAAVADSLIFEHKYNSAVIAFAQEDDPTPEQLEHVLNEFEKTAWAGLETDRYSWSAILHREDNGSCHIHVLSARVDLETGKSLNIASPGWQKTFDPLRDYLNYKNDWARPDDPARARILHPEHNAHIEASQLKQGMAAEPNAKQVITTYLTQRIEMGVIANRTDIIKALEEAGLSINRQGKNYISVRPEPDAKPIRLKGAIYEAGFQRESLERATQYQEPSRQERAGDFDGDRAQRAYDALQRKREQRLQYNRHRYEAAHLQHERAPSLDPESHGAEHSIDEATRGQQLDQAHLLGDSELSRVLHRDLGSDRIPSVSSQNPMAGDERSISDDRRAEQDLRHIESPDLGNRPNRRSGEGEIHRASRGDELQNRVERGRTQSHQITQGLRSLYDRVREAVIDRIRPIIDAVQAGYETYRNAYGRLVRATDQFERTKRDTDRSVQRSDRTFTRRVEYYRENRTDELEHFKRDINLPEYLSSEGYIQDKSLSSRNSVVMRNDHDKLIVATGKDGHGIYFNVKNDRDSGTIIDFIQNRRSANLGEVRVELRQYLREPKYAQKRIEKPIPTTSDRQRIIKDYAKTKPTEQHAYLAKRGISSDVLKDPRFTGRVRTDDRGNAIFPHYDRQGLSGFEMKNEGFTGFSKGGQKGLWISNNINHADQVFIVESAIDALSHAKLFPQKQAAYISVGGQMSQHQKELIRRYFNKTTAKGITLSTDRDQAGEELAKELSNLAPKELNLNRAVPKQGKDWNDALMEQQKKLELEMKRVRQRSFSLSR